jgi:hypothetical protein
MSSRYPDDRSLWRIYIALIFGTILANAGLIGTIFLAE